jgi:(p)ppGpp synthase/HD superfamily hydrolase
VNRYKALKHAVKAHAGQVDKCGQPYILHPIAVAEAVDRGPTPGKEGRGEFAMHWVYGDGQTDAVVVALLHDVLEDTDYEIPATYLTGTQAQALRGITRRTDREPFPETYAEYIERVCADPVTSLVKLADLWHNLQPERQDCLPVKERAGLEKRYLKARDRIWEALGYEWWPS